MTLPSVQEPYQTPIEKNTGQFAERHFAEILNVSVTDVSATKCRRNVFVAETFSKNLKTFVLETKTL